MSKSKQIESTVIKQFEDQIADYTTNALVEASHVPKFIHSKINASKRIWSIGEFGGGGGNLLAYIKDNSKKKIKLTNIEIVKKYKRFQTDKSIKFIHGSVLDSKIKSNTFDAVIVRNVIHHLVNNSLTETRNNQMDAIRELVRVTKPGGYIIIEEQVNNNHLACLIFFYLSKLATKLNIRVDRMQITPNTIVGYLPYKKLAWMCERFIDRKDWVKDEFEHWGMPWYWQVTGLMRNTGERLIIMKKPA